MNLKKVHHIAIIGSNYEKSKHFYVDLLGFSIIRENYRPERDDYKIDLQLDETVRELNKRGIITEPIRLDTYTGKRMTFFHDPDNLPLEIHE